MRIRQLPVQGLYRVYATCDSRGVPELLEFLEGLDANMYKDRTRMLALLEQVAEAGPPRNTDISHKLDGEIWEFIRGRLRVCWFFDEGRVVICTHGFVKKSQKTPSAEIRKAKQRHKAYTQACANSTLTIEVEADE
ncbi:type II toxin-antitoxin system RelE/ParE family toxin [Ectothiorhodospira marina]|uniref:Phage derived protein Gp49-like n=1 Tax=Ectothiorhodospira marina TaxID=1396821 RepID=A0A1H7RLL3_9GAMM|nr:type II toxin-antitoxin system RelE/ParE family toxin [Ectothiorhodospira marina]SEL61131.1 Phage derived protein Gp49-like [Ectothiorhodospira marina]